MMRFARRVSLLVAFSLLTSAATAHAACAWVLWLAASVPTLPDEGPGVVTAYPTMKDCEAALAKEYLRQKREGWDVHYVQVRTVLALKGKEDKITSMHWRCLPDTVDPRGPKRK